MKVAPGGTATFTLWFGNLSDSPDAFTIHGDGGAPGYRVTYLHSDHDVSAGILGGYRRTRIVERGDRAVYTLRIHVSNGVSDGSVLNVRVRSMSGLQPAIIDTVNARVLVRAPV